MEIYSQYVWYILATDFVENIFFHTVDRMNFCVTPWSRTGDLCPVKINMCRNASLSLHFSCQKCIYSVSFTYTLAGSAVSELLSESVTVTRS